MLNQMNANKAPGPDHFTADIVQHFTANNTDLITALYNKCLTLGLFPSAWKVAVVRILPKPGKDDYDELKSYRPIGLLDCFGIGIEKLFIRRLQWCLHGEGKLSRKQFGFTAQTSTVDALRSAIKKIKSAKGRGLQVVAVSLDIKAAFDNAWWPALITQLEDIECPRPLIKLIRNYLEDRSVELTYAGERVAKSMSKGCVQGSVCGPTLWNIILDALFEIILPEGCEIQAFADDVLLIGYHRSIDQLQANIEEALRLISDWGTSVKLTFSEEKTQALAFTQRSRGMVLSMNGTSIDMRTEIKLLGVIIDQDLKFHKHAIHAFGNANRIFKILCCLARPTWGVSAEIVQIMYLRAIEPGLTYACHIWQNALKFKYILTKLNLFQRGFAIRACKGFHTLSLTSALALSGFIPIDLRIREVAEIEEVKVRHTTEYLTDPPADRITVKSTDVETTESADALSALVQTSIFTDGSKLEGRVGSGFVVFERGRQVTFQKQKLGDHCSVFQAELVAIDHALKYILRRLTKSFCIFSDSKSSLVALNDRSNTNPLINAIHKKLRLITDKQVAWRFAWVRAAIGILGNEEADRVAKEATTRTTAPVHDTFPLTFAKLAIRRKTIESWNQRYMEADTVSVTRLFLPTIYHARQLHKLTKPTFEMTQVFSRHGFHKQYLERFKITADNACPCDNVTVQDVTHLPHDCPLFTEERRTLRGICCGKHVNFKNFTDILRHPELLALFQAFIVHIVSNLKSLNGTCDDPLVRSQARSRRRSRGSTQTT